MTGTRNTAARALAITGTTFVGLPLAAPIALAAIALVATGAPRLDYLMPGELFFVALAGGVLLLLAALLARRRCLLVVILTVLAAVLIAAVDLAAGLTGIGSGEVPATGVPFGIVLGFYGLYVADVVALFVVGVLLCRDLFARARPTAGRASRG